MYCDIIHEEYKKEYRECPFCNEKLEERKSIETNIECTWCGMVIKQQTILLIFMKISIE